MPIRINLLAESQAAEEFRRHDPVKRVIYVAAFLPPARHVDGSCQPDEAGGEDCLTDSQGRARQAGQLDQQARCQRVGKERQGFDCTAGKGLVLQDLIEVEGDGDECQPEEGTRCASERGGEVVPLFGVVWHRRDPPQPFQTS